MYRGEVEEPAASQATEENFIHCTIEDQLASDRAKDGRPRTGEVEEDASEWQTAQHGKCGIQYEETETATREDYQKKNETTSRSGQGIIQKKEETHCTSQRMQFNESARQGIYSP